jgi:CRISPR-associated protein Csm1
MAHEKLTLHEFVFSALMHDIGKVMQRAEIPLAERYKDRAKSHQHYDSHWHACWTDEFLDKNPCGLISKEKWQRMINLSASHHLESVPNTDDQNLLIMLKAADQLAADYDRGDKMNQNYKSIPLYSVFQEIRLKSEEPVRYQKAYQFKPLMADSFFPEDAKIKTRVADYKSLFDSFDQNYQQLSNVWTDNREFPHFLNSVDYLMEKYFYCVPGNTQEEHPTSSLYHHSRTTALIAAVLYQRYVDYETKLTLQEIKDSSGYMLIGGDLSGIQNYLYDLNPENSQKGTKFLRARSFKIKALSDMVLFKIINQCGLCQQNVLINAGGKFVLLAPESDVIKQQLIKIQQETDQTFYQEFLASVSLNLDWSMKVKFDDLHQSNLKETLEQFFDKLEVKKSTRFQSRLVTSDTGKWTPGAFIVNHEKLVNDNLCPYCNRRIKANDESCEICNQEMELGKRLPKNQFVVIANVEKDEREFARIGDTGLFLLKENNLNSFKNRLLKENATFSMYAYQRGEKGLHQVFPYKATAAYIPVENKNEEEVNVIDLETIARKSSIDWPHGKKSGLCANAIIKGDVDNLGSIFQKGLALPGNQLSLARYMTCSSQMDFFFSEYIPWLLENDSSRFCDVEIPFNTIYTVYTGGDDFCLIGPWLTVILFALRLKQDFDLFTCNNPELHFSCGIELMHGKSPAKFFIEKTEEALEKAKKSYDLKYKQTEKNSVFLFDTLIPWDEYDTFINQAEQYFNHLNNKHSKGFSTQFVYKLFHYHQSYMNTKYPNPKVKQNIRDLLYPAQITYDLKRNFNKEEPAYQSIQALIQIDNKKVKTDIFRLLKAILHVSLYANRNANKGGSNEL